MPLPIDKIDQLITGVYTGEISVYELPSFLYSYTVYELDGSFFAGFGEVPRGDIKTLEKSVNFRANIGRFSGAKTFQEVSDLTKAAFDGAKKRPFAEYKEIASKINAEYNMTWLQTEQDSVILQSQNARKWMKFEGEKEVFKSLKYVTVGDDRVRPDHKELDGLILPVDDPRWNSIMPQNGWKCRCTVLQLETGKTPDLEVEKKTRLIKDEFKKHPEFDFNPGKTDFIFKEKGKGKHNYFKVPRQFNGDLKNNFNFASVSEVTGIYI